MDEFQNHLLNERASYTRIHVACLWRSSRTVKLICGRKKINVIVASRKTGEQGLKGKVHAGTFWGADKVLNLDMGIGSVYTFVKTQLVYT